MLRRAGGFGSRGRVAAVLGCALLLIAGCSDSGSETSTAAATTAVTWDTEFVPLDELGVEEEVVDEEVTPSELAADGELVEGEVETVADFEGKIDPCSLVAVDEFAEWAGDAGARSLVLSEGEACGFVVDGQAGITDDEIFYEVRSVQ